MVEVEEAIAKGNPASVRSKRNLRRVHPDTEAPAASASSGNSSRSLFMSDANSLPDQIEKIGHALTAEDLSKLLTIFKQAAAGRIPTVRFSEPWRSWVSVSQPDIRTLPSRPPLFVRIALRAHARTQVGTLSPFRPSSF